MQALPAMLDDHIITTEMNKEISAYNDKQTLDDKEICDQLVTIIDNELAEAENKIWHAHPVWFLVCTTPKHKSDTCFLFAISHNWVAV